VASLSVLIVNIEFPPIGGGAGRACFYLLKEYAKKPDLNVHMITSAPVPGFYREQFAENITIFKVGLRKKHLLFWRKSEVIAWLAKAHFHYRKLLKTERYNLVHAFFGFPSGWLCWRSADTVPYIISLRGSDVPGEHPRLALDYRILAGLFARIWQRASMLIACSEGLKRRAHRFLPLLEIRVIPNGVDLTRFHPRGEYGCGTPVRLLTVGRLSRTKRVELLIDAVEILKQRGVDAELNIVGQGAATAMLEQLILRKGLVGKVKLTGFVDAGQIAKIYREHDIYVSASMQEGMSNSMLEAMASGLPIITTRCEGVDELIKDNGIVVEDGGAQCIATAIAGLTKDKSRYVNMAVESRKRAEKFTWASVADQYVRCYKAAAGRS